MPRPPKPQPPVGHWEPASNPPDTWRLVAWAWRVPTGLPRYSVGYFGGKAVSRAFRGWYQPERHGQPDAPPDYWCDFPPLPAKANHAKD